MRIDGKQSLIVTLPLILLLSSFGLVTFVYEESGIKYEAMIEPGTFGYNSNSVWGTVSLKITNTNDFDVSFTNVEIDLVNPKTGKVFYSYRDNGGVLNPSDVVKHKLPFNILIDEIPDTDIKITITGYLFWNGEGSELEKTIYLPIEFEI